MRLPLPKCAKNQPRQDPRDVARKKSFFAATDTARSEGVHCYKLFPADLAKRGAEATGCKEPRDTAQQTKRLALGCQKEPAL